MLFGRASQQCGLESRPVFLGRHTCLGWLQAQATLESVPPFIVTVGDRRRAARVLAKLDDGIDLAEQSRARFGPYAAGRVFVGVGRTGAASVLVVESQMGGSATEIILREVLDESFHPSGARAVIRVGTCGTLSRDGELPDVVVADAAVGWSGAIEQSRRGVLATPPEADPGRPPRPPSLPCTPSVVDALRQAAKGAAVGGVFSKDSLYAQQDERFAQLLREFDCIATEMEIATIGPLAEEMGIAWGGIMATGGHLDHEWYPLERIARNEDLAIDAALGAIRALA